MNKMIKRYNEYISEKLSDKLSGFDEEGLKQQLIDKKLDLGTYLDICEENNIKFNFDNFKHYFLNGELNFYNIYYIIKNDYKYIKLPDENYIRDIYLSGELDIFRYYKICKENNFKTPTDEDILNSLKKLSIEDILNISIKNNILIGVKYAIKQDISQNLKSKSLMQAIDFDNFQIIKILIDNNAKIPTDKVTRFVHSAVTSYNLELIKYIFNHFELYNYINYALTIAASLNDVEILKYIFECGADIHYNDDNALYIAASFDIYNNVKYLLEHGANVNKNLLYYVKNENVSENIKNILKKYYDKQNV